MAYRIYVTDALRMMNENVAMLYKGKYTKVRYIEMIKPAKAVKEDNRSGREIADDIIAKTGIKLVKSNGN